MCCSSSCLRPNRRSSGCRCRKSACAKPNRRASDKKNRASADARFLGRSRLQDFGLHAPVEETAARIAVGRVITGLKRKLTADVGVRRRRVKQVTDTESEGQALPTRIRSLEPVDVIGVDLARDEGCRIRVLEGARD